MTFFLRKVEQTGIGLGAKLKALRRDRGFNYEQAAQATRIPKAIIKALERNDFNALPASIYARRFLRTYVRFLGGDEEYFLECFNAERGTCDLIDPLLLPRRRARRALFLVTPRIFKAVSISASILIIFGYLGWEFYRIITPPTIEINSPLDGLATDRATIEVAGRVFEEAEVTVNGTPILLDRDGSFSVLVDLEFGLNLISIEAKKRYSQSSRVDRRVVFERLVDDLSAESRPLLP